MTVSFRIGGLVAAYPSGRAGNQLEASRWLIDGELSMLDQIAHSGGS